ncbi:formylglycine-generating enzyme family protein [Streptomyces sp. NPDC088261]|uniref:formylglycine-generating enzyme family protein n=1 Tax=Streptomyces sp. NPDC088261 TaxID=3365851 RepID=UPI0037FE649F
MGPSAEDETMTAVPPGRVTLSDRRTQRSWPVEVAPYLLGVFPVTQASYAAVTGLAPITARGGRLPVEGVSWGDAVRYCNARSEREGLTPAYDLPAPPSRPSLPDLPALPDDTGTVTWDTSADGYRLPTEAEWEHACRAGTTDARYGQLDDIAWHRGNSLDHVHEVGGKRPNAWGLYDMVGNVWEWCWDLYDPEVYASYRVLRGGGWFDEHWSCRASVRRRSHPTFRIDDVGFRVARSVVG